MRQPYTAADIKRGQELREQGKPWKEIARLMGRNEKALYSKFAKVRRARAETPVKRTYKKKEIVMSPTGITTYRPMIALVGSPSEVTTTIRELFS